MTSEWQWITRLILAGICSGIIGWERERHGREAGLRTTILVGMGTATIMVTSLRIQEIFVAVADSRISIDPARIAYGAVTGIGFLGAGAIVKDSQRVRGLTTAACLWSATAIGLAAGCGLVWLAVAATGLSLLTLNCLKLIEHKIPRDEYYYLTVSLQDTEADFNQIQEILQKASFTILSVAIARKVQEKITSYHFTLRHRSGYQALTVPSQISCLPGVVSFEWK